MRLIIFIGILFLFASSANAQEEKKMYCFASINDLNGVTVISEIYKIPILKKDMTSFKIINSNSYYKLISEKGYKLPYNKDAHTIPNVIRITKNWEEINTMYEDIQKKSNGNFIIIDKDSYSIIFPSKKEVLIRE